MAHQVQPAQPNILWRAMRIVIPWIALIIVITVVWSMVSEYRRAAPQSETTSTVETTQTSGVPAGEPYVEILSDGLNLRAEPSTTAAVLAVLDSGSQVPFVEAGTGWYHIRTTEGVEGWVAAGGAYTRLVEP